MKQFFAAAVLLMGGLSLIAWGGRPRVREGADRPIELTWVSDDNPARVEQIDLFRQFAASLGRPDVTARLDPGNNEVAKIVVQTVGGVGPDLFDVYGRNQLVAYAQAGLPWDVTEKARAAGIGPEILWPSLSDGLLVDGRQYCFPTNAGPWVLFYNKEVFDRCGVPYPRGDWTWDEFLQTARRLTRRRADGRGYDSYGILGMDLLECVWQNGGRMFSPDGRRCVIDTPEAIEAARWFYALQNVEHVAPSPAEENAMAASGGWGQGSITLFSTGRIAMYRYGRWGLIRWRDVPGLRLGICPLPYRKVRACQLAWRATAINPKSPHRDEAFLFLRYLASRPYCEQINRSADANAAVERYCHTPLFLHDPQHPGEDFNPLWIDEMAHARMAESSLYVNPFVSDRILQSHTDLLRNGGESPEQAMRARAAEINAEIARTLRKDPELRRRYQGSVAAGAIFSPRRHGGHGEVHGGKQV